MEINSKNMHVPKKKIFSLNVTRGSVTQVTVNSEADKIGKRNQRIMSNRYNTKNSKLKLYGAERLLFFNS
jgi:hypothetical protein